MFRVTCFVFFFLASCCTSFAWSFSLRMPGVTEEDVSTGNLRAGDHRWLLENIDQPTTKPMVDRVDSPKPSEKSNPTSNQGERKISVHASNMPETRNNNVSKTDKAQGTTDSQRSADQKGASKETIKSVFLPTSSSSSSSVKKNQQNKDANASDRGLSSGMIALIVLLALSVVVAGIFLVKSKRKRSETIHSHVFPRYQPNRAEDTSMMFPRSRTDLAASRGFSITSSNRSLDLTSSSFTVPNNNNNNNNSNTSNKQSIDLSGVEDPKNSLFTTPVHSIFSETSFLDATPDVPSMPPSTPSSLQHDGNMYASTDKSELFRESTWVSMNNENLERSTGAHEKENANYLTVIE